MICGHFLQLGGGFAISGAAIAKWGPLAIAVAAAVACTVSTAGACGPLAYASIYASVVSSAYENGIISRKPSHPGRFCRVGRD